MQVDKLSPYIRVAMDSVLEPTWKMDERVIWDYELLYLMEGQMLVTVEDVVYHGRAGDCFFFKPGQKHAIHNIGGTRVRQPHVHFDLYVLPDSQEVGVSFKQLHQMNTKEKGWFRNNELSASPFLMPTHFRLGDPFPLEQSLFELIREFETKPPFYEIRIKGCLLAILSLIMREQYWGSKTKSDGQLGLLTDIRSYIEHNVHRCIKLDELSERFHISKFHLIHLFKNLFQQTPIQYHQQIRIEKAKMMIQFTYLPMQDIAEQLGYSNIHAFSRAFKGSEGCSPSKYRQEK